VRWWKERKEKERRWHWTTTIITTTIITTIIKNWTKKSPGVDWASLGDLLVYLTVLSWTWLMDWKTHTIAKASVMTWQALVVLAAHLPAKGD